MSSELFEVYETDFKDILYQARQRYIEKALKASGEEQKQQIRELERCLEQANKLLRDMENESRKAPTSFRMQMTSSLRTYRSDVDQLTRDIKRLQTGQRFNSHDFGVDMNEEESFETRQRARLLQGTASLNRASDSLARSHAISAETDEIGAEILGDLDHQRESLERTRNRLSDTDQNLSQSRKILNTMRRRVLQNKLLLLIIIFCELCILAGVVYWKFFRKT